MKTFDSLKKLLEYCEICPVCKDNRVLEPHIDFGPEAVLSGESFLFFENIITISFDFKFHYNDTKCRFIFSLNTETYSFKHNLKGEYHLDIFSTYFEFYFVVKCKCNSLALTSDFSPKLKENQPFYLDKEEFHLIDTENKYFVMLIANHGFKSFARVGPLSKVQNVYVVNENNLVRIPYVELDYSDQAAAIEKLKMYIALS